MKKNFTGFLNELIQLKLCMAFYNFLMALARQFTEVIEVVAVDTAESLLLHIVGRTPYGVLVSARLPVFDALRITNCGACLERFARDPWRLAVGEASKHSVAFVEGGGGVRVCAVCPELFVLDSLLAADVCQTLAQATQLGGSATSGTAQWPTTDALYCRTSWDAAETTTSGALSRTLLLCLKHVRQLFKRPTLIVHHWIVRSSDASAHDGAVSSTRTHLDHATQCVAASVYLNAAYEGGSLQVEVPSSASGEYRTATVPAATGRCVFFAGSRLPHSVTQIRSGVRHQLLIWFCEPDVYDAGLLIGAQFTSRMVAVPTTPALAVHPELTHWLFWELFPRFSSGGVWLRSGSLVLLWSSV
jgi:hypothetical protein